MLKYLQAKGFSVQKVSNVWGKYREYSAILIKTRSTADMYYFTLDDLKFSTRGFITIGMLNYFSQYKLPRRLVDLTAGIGCD